jgi:hypothetical protein
MTFPDLPSELTEVPATTNPLGVKAAGEAGATGAPPRVVGASSTRSNRSASITSTCRQRRAAFSKRSTGAALAKRQPSE